MIKLDLGCGFNKPEKYIGIDIDPAVNPDYVLDLEKNKLPFDDDSVDEVRSCHFLEHIGDGFYTLMQEIYRVSKNGALFYVRVPYFRSDLYHNDPSHKRFISFGTLNHLDKKYCKWNYETYNSSSGLANLYNINFEIKEYKFHLNPDYKEEIEEKHKTIDSHEKFTRWLHDTNNIISELEFHLVVVK